MAHSTPPSDRQPAFTGLIVGAVLTFAILLGVVKWTNARFAGHEGAAAAPATQAH
ncbi:MAG: hypothetical protein MUF21_02830 [Gemmatimonadaceae bacterium]|nr:hypothetical protein [Gemmatimonadaceae bacterium]